MDGKYKILIVDDEEHISELISLYLTKEGFETKEAFDGRSAIDTFINFNPNLILLDIMLPGMDGYEVCREIRKMSDIPVIMLTAKGEVFDRVLGLELGADDYIIKPFDSKELVARVKAVLRRYNGVNHHDENKRKIVLSNLVIDEETHTVTYRGDVIELPPKEFELLFFLASASNRVFTREQLLDKIWGYEFFGDTRTVDVHIKRLREKLPGDNTWSIKTVWGVGYKLEVQ